MSFRLFLTLAAFALLLAFGLAAPAAAQDDPGAIRVGVVVQGPDGLPQTFCVTLEPGATGLDALEATGLPLASEQGPLGATVGLLMWFWVSVYVVLLGAELNVALLKVAGSTEG